LSGTEDLEIVERLGIKKSKKTKLDIYTPSNLIKTTHEPHSSNINDEFSKQRNDSLCPNKKQGVTVVMAVMVAENKSGHSSKKSPTKKLVRVLLDTGSDGDLLFHQKGTTKQFPYLTRQVPKSWCMLNGTFQMKGKGDLQLKFFQYSNSKRVKIQPDVVEYGKGAVEKPMFDLILGIDTTDELLGIILNIKQRICNPSKICLNLITKHLL
jgi:hypothetical protein